MSAGPHEELQIVEIYWAQLRSVDERLWRRARARAQRRQLARMLALALLALLLAAAVAVAAKALLFGTSAPPAFPPQAATLGELKPGGTRLLSVRQGDADGGPHWGVRVFRTQRGDRTCLQVGRVVRGTLSAVGVAGAFGGDGLAHALPVEAQGCTRAGADGHVRATLLVQPLPRSGLLSSDRPGDASGCLDPDVHRAVLGGPADARRYIRRARARGDAVAVADGERHLALAERRLREAAPACGQADLRTVVVGLAGPDATSVTLTSRGVERRHPVRRAEDGAFLFVLVGHRRQPGTLVVRYSDGATCPLGDLARPGALRPGAGCERARTAKP